MSPIASSENRAAQNTSTLGFKSHLRALCQASPRRLGFAEADDPRILETARLMLDEHSVSQISLFTDGSLARTFLSQALTSSLNHEEAFLGAATAAGFDLSSYRDRLHIISSERHEEASLMHAARMLARGELDAVLGGNKATTADVIRAGIKGVGLATGVRTVSGAFLMNHPQGATYLYADCGVVIAPTLTQLVDIATEAVASWQRLFPDIPPVVAFLSFSTKGSATHETAIKMAEAAQLFAQQRPEVASDGELQFDAALVPQIGAQKAPASPAAGRANCFIFPDLGAGNIAYKITQRLGGFEAYGPILQGLAQPFSDLSRGATVSDITASAYISLLRATPVP